MGPIWLALAGCGERDVARPAGPPLVEDTGVVTRGGLVFDGSPPRNVWMVSIDTLRRDHVDPHAGDGVERTPFLAARMAEGFVLADHQQCGSWTLHGMSCTLLGRPPEEIGWIPRLDGLRSPMPDGQRTLAVRLREVGYHPLVASTNSWFGAAWNSVQGYEPELGSDSDALAAGQAATDGLRAEIANEPGRPWFLHLHLFEPHAPWNPPAPFLDEVSTLPPLDYDLGVQTEVDRLRVDWPSMPADAQALAAAHVEARYSADVRWLDESLGRVWSDMEAEGWLDDTLVVVWTDHGEALFDHRELGHGRRLYREENDGVLFFWAKNLRPGVTSGPTHGVDLLPTILAVLDVDAGDVLPGHVVGMAPTDRVRLVSTVGFYGPMVAATVAGDKMLYRFDGSLERYDLAVDPGEENDLHEPGDPISDAMWRSHLEPWMQTVAALVPEAPVPP